MAPPKAKLWSKLLWLLLLPIPLVWCLLAHYGVLTFLENKTLDWRFQYRGPIPAPVRVVYVNIDPISIDEIGGWPWSRTFFATVSSALIDIGGARAVGYDFVFSDLGVSQSVDLRMLVQGNLEFGRYMTRGSAPVVLAAAYAGHTFRDINGVERNRELPLVKSERGTSAEWQPPEMPAFRRSLDEAVFNYPAAAQIGLIDTLDNGTRTVPVWAPNNSFPPRHFHMAVQLARLYWGLTPESLRLSEDRLDFMRADGSLQATVPLHDGQLLDVNWFSSWSSGDAEVPDQDEKFSFSTVYATALVALMDESGEERQGAREVLVEKFKDAVVLIGPTDPLLQDIATTPMDELAVPKVSVHGNLLKTIVSGRYLKRLPEWSGIAWAEWAIVFLVTLAVTAIGLSKESQRWYSGYTKLMAAVALAGYVVICFEFFTRLDLVLPLTAPVGSALTASLVGLTWQVFQEQKAKGRIKGMFGTYLAPTVVEQMIDSGKDPELGGHDAEITAYFSDIQNFSSFSEVLPSSKLGELLNEYLTACTDIVQTEMGTLDKYIGDAVVAMFGAPVDAPDHAARACIASQIVQKRIAELRDKWRGEGDKWPQLVHNLRTRIGLNTGVCMIGNMGSRTRFNYTMMGDNVNLAARMESGAKSWGVYTMCTDTTKQACVAHARDRIVFRSLGRIVVKGRSQPVPIHEIVGLREDVSDRTLECIALFEQGLARYYERDWDGALELFRRSHALEALQPGRDAGVAANASTVYLDIVAHCRVEPPPADWDGRYVMKEK